MGAIGETLEFPAVVSDYVVMTTERGEVLLCGGSSIRPGLSVVEIAVGSEHGTSGEHTGRICRVNFHGPGAGHNLAYEHTAFTIKLIRDFVT